MKKDGENRRRKGRGGALGECHCSLTCHTQMFGEERRNRRRIRQRTGEQGRSEKPPPRRRGGKGERKETRRIRSGDRTWDR